MKTRKELKLPVQKVTTLFVTREIQINLKFDPTPRIFRYKGTAFQTKVVSAMAQQFLSMMPEKPEADASKMVVSPMPGLVKSVTCNVGDMVAEGQELCVIGKFVFCY